VRNLPNSALERIEVLDSHCHCDGYNYGGNAHNYFDLSEFVNNQQSATSSQQLEGLNTNDKCKII